MNNTANDERLVCLRMRVSKILSEKRFLHTLGVEKIAVRLASLCLSDKIFEISVAALLHDVTKELSLKDHIDILKNEGRLISDNDIESPQILHSFTAPYFVSANFPEFAVPEILSAIGKHTLGDCEMDVFDEIIFLADFIEENRKIPISETVRNFVFSEMSENDPEKNILVLHRACIMEIDSTIRHLNAANLPVHEKTLLAKKYLLSKI